MTEQDPLRPERADPDAELDRLVARSLAASERGARNASAAPAPARAPWPWIAAALLLALLLGMVANPWFERQLRATLPPALQEGQATGAPATPDLAPLDARIAAMEATLAREAQAAGAAPAPSEGQVPAIEARLSSLEATAERLQAADSAASARLDRLVTDLAMLSGGGAAQQEQVRAFLLLSATRQLFERGRLITPLLPAIEARFGAGDPEAVAALSVWNSAPVTRQSLATRLAQWVAADSGATPAQGWWQAVRQRLSRLLEVRVAASDQQAETVRRAAAALAGDDLEAAIAAMQPAAATEAGRAWIADVRRLAAAEAGLERLDLALADSLAAMLAAPVPDAAAQPAIAAPAGR